MKYGYIESLYIDKSNHPSILGYIFLNNLAKEVNKLTSPNEIDALSIYRKSEKSINMIKSVFRSYPYEKIVGDSILVRHIQYFRNRNLMDDFYGFDIVKLPELESYIEDYNDSFIYVTDIYFDGNAQGFDDRLKRIQKVAASGKFKLCAWKAWALEVNKYRFRGMTKKTQYSNSLLFSYKTIELLFSEYIIKMPDPSSKYAASLVEINQDCQPTFKGLLYIYYSSLFYDNFNSIYESVVMKDE